MSVGYPSQKLPLWAVLPPDKVGLATTLSTTEKEWERAFFAQAHQDRNM